MNLGIEGRTALVCASSRGLGRACATALAQEGVIVFVNGRQENVVARAAAEIRAETGGVVHAIAADVASLDGQQTLLAVCPQPDILAANMIAPLTLIRAVLPAMVARMFGRIVYITSAMVATPRPHMTLSAGSRAGLTAVLKGVSLDVARHNVTINNMLPERFDTARQEQMAQLAMKRDGISYH